MSIEEQALSKEKYPSLFSRKMEAIQPHDALRPIAREQL